MSIAELDKPVEPRITPHEVRDALRYDEATGAFTWVNTKSLRRLNGQEAGCLNKAGYRVIWVGGSLRFGHRLAWFYVHGKWPEGQIDHINGDKGDNRIANLRACVNAENSRNRPANRNNTSGFKGVSWNKRDSKWRAQIKVNRKGIGLGNYSTREEAAAAYQVAAIKYHGEFARVS